MAPFRPGFRGHQAQHLPTVARVQMPAKLLTTRVNRNPLTEVRHGCADFGFFGVLARCKSLQLNGGSAEMRCSADLPS